jgi:hypothetical protein
MERTSPKDLLAVLRNEERAASAWAGQAERLLASERLGAALLAEARAVGAGASPERLRGWLRDKAVQEAGATEEALAAVAKMKRFDDEETSKLVARLLDGLARGGEAPSLLAAVADTLREAGERYPALDLARAALALLGEGEAAEGVALGASLFASLVELGRFDDARAALDAYVAPDATRAASLRTTLTALTHPFDFRAAQYLEGEAEDDAELSPRSLGEAQAGVTSIARRAAIVRAAIVALVGERSWLPDVAPLLAGGATLLPDDDFDAEAPSESLPDLVFELRKEWARLSWAIAALGGTTLAVPGAVVKPRCAMDFVDTFTAARYDLLCDVVEGKAPEAHDELERRLLASTFAGTPLGELDPALAQRWLEETEAALAGLRWAMGRTATPWSPE